jgi:hypothetical protein
MAISRIALEGLPHSEIFGSKPVCGSPKLIAAYHVLHRRPAPRHPPYALSSLTTAFTLLENTVVFVRLSLRAFKNKDLRLSMIRGLGCPAAASVSDTTARLSPEGKDERWRPRLSREKAGGADRARTGDPLVANQVLSQLSYSPEAPGWWA